MALLPTLVALGIGAALGLRWGGRLEHLLEWRPAQPLAFGGGLALVTLVDLTGWGGSFSVLLVLAGTAALLWFSVLNVHTGGMVLVVAGLGLNLLVTLVNWGTPVSGAALVSSGVIEQAALDTVELTSGRRLADGALFGFLGDVIPLPWGHVLSVGDLLVLAGVTLVTASVMRRYQVRGSSRPRPSGGRRTIGGPSDYRTALDALGRGPAPRRGPGLHPSRLDERRRPRQRPPTRPARPPGRGPR